MPTSVDSVSRTPKKNPHEVITYEIDMLRYCFEQLTEATPRDICERNVLLESYLLHYRNLIEFMGATKPPLRSDLTFQRPEEWATRTLTEGEVAAIRAMATPLFSAYFKNISQQLQHMTHPRFTGELSWPVADMHTKIEALLVEFEKLGAASR